MSQLLEIDTSWGAYFNAAMCYHNCLLSYFMDEKADKAALWLLRADSVAEKLFAHPAAIDQYKELIKYNLTCDRIDLAVLQKRFDDANRYYNEVKNSPQAQTVSGQYKLIDYLRDLHRYAEAADAYQSLGPMIEKNKMNPSLDFVATVAGKFRVNYMAGRKDSALAAALFAFDYIDSAIVRERNNEAAKLATIYQTHQKDEEIARQQIDMNRQRIVALVIVLVLITAFFIVYTLFRRRAAKRMAEMKAQQERIESELRIARDIQMSMVPSTFPEYEGLDLYATMTPAKEVGGDLYGYVINGHNLYFAVGDVSGKGVPASLFMAQATRLFRTMANQGLMPAEICNHMNAELSGEDNVNGMFVTMFIGMLNMENGHLHYCNAGHNPPVIGGGENKGDFLEMESNAPIGLFPEMDYQGEEMESIKGRALFIYTDGLNEAEDGEQRQFGDDQLLEILRDTHFDSARQVVETLTQKVEEHRAGAEPNDDLTMLCLRVS
jgi:serine phosphatase RsbU (regulator of sigma subunit)